jgi:hypothetical protein
MIWRTSRGKRVLPGTERELFLAAFGSLVDQEYVTAFAPDPSESERQALSLRLRELIHLVEY